MPNVDLRMRHPGIIPGLDQTFLVHTDGSARFAVNLEPGDYVVNAAFGRANLTRKIVVKPGSPPYEAFVLNAGGLRLASQALSGG